MVMKKLIDLFRRARHPANNTPAEAKPNLPVAATAPINRENLSNFYNGLWIALPDDTFEEFALDHYCFLYYAYRDMPEIGPDRIEQIREARRELYGLISNGEGQLLPDEQIDRDKVVEWLFKNEEELATVYNGLKSSWAKLAAKAGIGETDFTLYRPATEPVWRHMQDNDQYKHSYTTGIETFIKIYEKIPSMRKAIGTAKTAPALKHDLK